MVLAVYILVFSFILLLLYFMFSGFCWFCSSIVSRKGAGDIDSNYFNKMPSIPKTMPFLTIKVTSV